MIDLRVPMITKKDQSMGGTIADIHTYIKYGISLIFLTLSSNTFQQSETSSTNHKQSLISTINILRQKMLEEFKIKMHVT